MEPSLIKKILTVVAWLGILWLLVQFILPVLLPFFLGALLAVAAEPAVALGVKRLHLRRGLASGIGVSLTLVFAGAIVWLLGAVAVQEIGILAKAVPHFMADATAMQDWLLSVADNAPDGIRTLAQRTVLDFFDNGNSLLQQLSSHLPGMVGSFVSGVGSSVLWIGTGILAAFLISARLPKLQQILQNNIPVRWKESYLPALRKIRHTLGAWLKAQGKLSLVTWGIVSIGLLVLRVPYAPLWAGLIAVVDAIPILGTGTVLVPWSVVCFLQGDGLRGIGLLCVYGAAAITRTVLEPRLVGRHLGLDPLITLLALYVGYRIWGIAGMLITPILASAGKSLLIANKGDTSV